MVEEAGEVAIAGHTDEVNGHIFGLHIAVLQVGGLLQTSVLKVGHLVELEGCVKLVAAAAAGAKDRTVEGLTRLALVVTGIVQVVENGTKIGTFAYIAGKVEVEVVFFVVGNEAALVTDIGIGGGGIVEAHIAWRDGIDIVGIAEEEIGFVVALEVECGL